ncbi:beta-sandwich lipoprotein [Ligilactobacillus aviarius]|uniref:Lipoprotein n=1 Tax=Ligilactobacillus aviarius TaxID=1606 RepID=A0A510WUG8_9LACO|nr:hypothetical protein [Ligilactobacillus aviarius]GEK42261.1 hypothetical protein LAV01_10930 [Ligilactobacillus aviarius]
MSKRIKYFIYGFVAVLVMILAGCGIHWYFTSTASGIRTAVNFKSNVNNGMEREITVYNADGKVIMHMKGKFDIQHSNRSLQYIDQNHMKHNIYFGDNTTVTVNEVKK